MHDWISVFSGLHEVNEDRMGVAAKFGNFLQFSYTPGQRTSVLNRHDATPGSGWLHRQKLWTIKWTLTGNFKCIFVIHIIHFSLLYVYNYVKQLPKLLGYKITIIVIIFIALSNIIFVKLYYVNTIHIQDLIDLLKLF